MQRVMLFIDFENFNIGLEKYYQSLNKRTPKLDYITFSRELIKLLPNECVLLKTFMFIPKPDDFLMQNEKIKQKYNWLSNLRNQNYITIIEGQHIARPLAGLSYDTMDISNPKTYFVVEKGTDINMGVHIVTKAFLNAYDVAIVLSGDSDYIPVLQILDTVGKITVSAGVKGQNLSRLKPHSDDIIMLDDELFAKCVRDSSKK